MTRPRRRTAVGQADAAEKLPRHIAFIMDGNGRWARRRGLPRLRGHEQGAEALRRITRHCRKIGIPEITFYALSSENYRRRPRSEVRFLLSLLRKYLIEERPELTEQNIRLKVIGAVEEFPARVLRELERTLALTEHHDGMVLRLALNYGGRQEILSAVRSLIEDAAQGRLRKEDIVRLDERLFASRLDDPEMPDPDLLVRTGGEYRISNFLLWQISYTELWVTERLWPDFDVPDLEEAFRDYRRRERRFGGVSAEKSRRRARTGSTGV